MVGAGAGGGERGGEGAGGGLGPYHAPEAPPPDGDQVEFRAIVASFVCLLRRSMPGLVGALVIVAAALCVLQVPQWALNVAAAASPALAPSAAAVGVCSSCVLALAAVVAHALQAGCYRTARRLLLEPGARTPSATAVLGEARADFVPLLVATVIYGAALVVGLTLCILPGFVAFVFLVFLPYLVSTQALDLGTAVTRAIEIAQAHAVALVVTLVVAVLALAGVGAVLLALHLVVQGVAGPTWASALLAPIDAVALGALGIGLWLWVAAALVTIDAAEARLPLVVPR